MRARKVALRACRDYAEPAPEALPMPDAHDALWGYISLLCAEGHFSLAGGRARLAVRVRRDDRPLLDMLARAKGLGNVYDDARAYPPSKPATRWIVARQEHAARLARCVEPAMLAGRKTCELGAWRRGLEEVIASRRERRGRNSAETQEAMDPLLDARRYRAPSLIADDPARETDQESPRSSRP